MNSIRMVSNEEGERLRIAEIERQTKIKSDLLNAKIIDIVFAGIGITDHTIEELILEKEGKKIRVSIEADTYYGSIISELTISKVD